MQFTKNNNAESFHNLLKFFIETNSPNQIKFHGTVRNEADKIETVK